MAKVIKVHALVETNCTQCGSICHRIGTATVLPDGRIGDGEFVGEATCNDCLRLESEQRQQAIALRRMQDAWVKKAKQMPAAQRKDGE